MEEVAYLEVFTLSQAHELLVELYGDHLHHNNENHLGGGMAYDALWQRRWQRLAAQSSRWHVILLGGVRRRFTARLSSYW